MATTEDLKKKLQDLQNNLATVLSPVAKLVSGTGKTIVENTILNQGFGAEYSDTQLPSWFNKKSTLNKKSTKQMNKKPTNSWKEIRQAAGLQTAYVDLNFSAEMWRGIQPQTPYMEGKLLLAPLAHNNVAGQKKMDWNRARYGDFFFKVLEGENMDYLNKLGVDEAGKIINEFLKPT